MEEETSYEDVYKNYFQDESTNSYFFNDSSLRAQQDLNEWFSENLGKPGDVAGFRRDVLDRKIKIKKKPPSGFMGWFLGESTEKENLDYTYDLYRKKMDQLRGQGNEAARQRMVAKLKEDEEIRKYKIEYFRDKNKDITYIHNNLISQFAGEIGRDKSVLLPNYEPMTDNLDFLAIRKRFSSSEETRNFLIQRTRENYNEINKYYTEKIKIYKYLSAEQKQKLKEEEKTLDEILKRLKPLITEQPIDTKPIDELEEKISSKKLKQETLDTNILLQKQRFDLANSKIEDLKKRKAEIKYKISIFEKEAERKKADKKLQFKKRIDSLYDAIAKINLEIESLDKIRKKASLLPPKILISKSRTENRLDILTSKQRSMVTDRKIFFERLRNEFSNRLRERVEKAEKMYQQEKLVTDKKINEANNRKKIAKQLITEEKEKYDDLKSQASFQKSSVSEKQALLDEVKEQIKKLKQVEADRQKLVADSIQRDVEELNSRKQVYSKLLDVNKDFLANKKKEISARQQEIEKLISIETENEKLKYAENRKDSAIQKSVFETLGDMKDSVVSEENRIEDVKKTLSDISDDIVRKEVVYNILDENISKIENNELSDLQTENKILEQEIILTQKLTDETLTKTERVELLNEEKEDIIDRLENLKSLTLKKIYNARKEAIELEVKKTLTLSADELKSEIFSLKYEIKKLEIKKLVSEEKEDLLNFQLKNFKKELQARKKEIDLLKQIESTKRKKERDEVRSTIADIVNRIEDENISRDVEEKLDEILDDVEDEDYDYLADDDIDKKLEFLPTKFKEPIQSLVQKERENKMAEDIEMRDRSRRVEKYQDDYEEGETSFAEWDSYSANIFVDKIEDPEMRSKVHSIFAEMDAGGEEKVKMKESYKTAINNALWEDQLDYDMWDGLIIPEEKEKFAYEQKLNNLNTALADSDIFLDHKDPEIKSFIDNNLTETFSDKRKEINGYSYLGKQIIGRTVARVFYLKRGTESNRFVEKLKSELGNSARSTLASESSMGDENVKSVAKEYITELREEQYNIIDNVDSPADMRQAQEDINDIEKDIKLIKRNSSFKIRMKVFKRTLSYRITKLLRMLWRAKARNKVALAGFLIAVISGIFGFWGTEAVIHNLKKAAISVKHYSDNVQAMGKNIIRTVQSIYRVPGTIVGYILIGIGIFLKALYWVTRISGTSGTGALFGALGFTFEALIYFENNIQIVNEKAADIVEEGGNFIEDFGLNMEKRVRAVSKKWYWDKPTEKKTILEIIESGANKGAILLAKGVQKSGKKIEETGETLRNSLWYLRIFIIAFATIIIIKWIRD